MNKAESGAEDLVGEITALSDKLARARSMVARRIIGQDEVIHFAHIFLIFFLILHHFYRKYTNFQ
ncbi:MAG: hypothetical protein P8X69_11630, partial [Maritimibacter sp.]